MTTASIVLALFLAVEPPAPALRGPLLLDFHAEWCGPCRSMRPTIAELQRRKFPVRTIDVDEQPELAERFEIERLPTFVVVDAQGEVVFREEGAQSAATLAKWIERARDAASDDGEVAVQPIDVADGQPEEVEAQPARPNPRPWQSVVRITVKDGRAWGYGSGTVIKSTADETLILTCAHIFPTNGRRPVPPSEFALPVTVEFFDGKLGGPGGQTVRPIGAPHRARVVDYDHDLDVGLVSVRPGRVMPASKVVPPRWKPSRDFSMYTVGCSHGQDATAWNTRITEPLVRGLDGKRSYEAIQCSYSPKQGRSGGGLFTDDGYLAGVCNFAFHPRLSQGLYATPRSIYKILDRNNLQDVYSPPRASPESALAGRTRPKAGGLVARGQEPSDDADSAQTNRLLAVEPITVPPPGLLGVDEPGDPSASPSERGVSSAMRRTGDERGLRWRPVSSSLDASSRLEDNDTILPDAIDGDPSEDQVVKEAPARAPRRPAREQRQWKPLASPAMSTR